MGRLRASGKVSSGPLTLVPMRAGCCSRRLIPSSQRQITLLLLTANTASASSEVKPVPDGVVVRCGSGHPLSGLAKDATIEVKTVNSLHLGTRTPRNGLPGSFEEILTDCDGQVPPGTAMRFCYPKDDKFTSSLSHQTKILLQVSIVYQPSRSVKLTQAAHRSVSNVRRKGLVWHSVQLRGDRVSLQAGRHSLSSHFHGRPYRHCEAYKCLQNLRHCD